MTGLEAPTFWSVCVTRSDRPGATTIVPIPAPDRITADGATWNEPVEAYTATAPGFVDWTLQLYRGEQPFAEPLTAGTIDGTYSVVLGDPGGWVTHRYELGPAYNMAAIKP